MPVSDYAVERMGFEPTDDFKTLEADFFTTIVFEVRGFTLGDEPTSTRPFTVAGSSCVVGVGNSINELSDAVIGHPHVEDEDAWLGEAKATPPFVMVRLGPSGPHLAESPRVKLDGDTILTYDAFSNARAELDALVSAVLPQIEASLYAVFDAERPLVLRFVERNRFGQTSEGRIVIDLRLELNASAYVSTSLPEGALASSLASAADLAKEIVPAQAKFLQDGLRTDDLEKRFLYLFIALEREVHRVFRTVSKADHVRSALDPDPRTRDVLSSLIEHRLHWNNVADRFVWCVTSTWADFDADDVALFRRLKDLRDNIAHGSGPPPRSEDVRALQTLALRVIGGAHRSAGGNDEAV